MKIVKLRLKAAFPVRTQFTRYYAHSANESKNERKTSKLLISAIPNRFSAKSVGSQQLDYCERSLEGFPKQLRDTKKKTTAMP